MLLRKRELQNYDAEQVRAHIVDALNLVAELDPPSDLRKVTFSKAVDLLSGKQIMVEQSAPTVPGMMLPNGG